MDDKLYAPRRIQIPVYADDWMRGDRYGDIVGQFRRNGDLSDTYRVKLDKSGKVRRFVADDCTHVD